MSIPLKVPAPPGWYLCYNDDPKRPATAGGRAIAWSQRYESKEDADSAAEFSGMCAFTHAVQMGRYEVQKPQRIGVYDLASARDLLARTVERLDPTYKGPYDAQALIQYLEALVLQARMKA